MIRPDLTYLLARLPLLVVGGGKRCRTSMNGGLFLSIPLEPSFALSSQFPCGPELAHCVADWIDLLVIVDCSDRRTAERLCTYSHGKLSATRWRQIRDILKGQQEVTRRVRADRTALPAPAPRARKCSFLERISRFSNFCCATNRDRSSIPSSTTLALHTTARGGVTFRRSVAVH